MNPNRARVTKMKAAKAIGPNPNRWEMPPKHDACGKRRCRTLDQAIAYALYLTKSRAGHPLRVYGCPACGGWHVTKIKTWQEP